MMVLIRMRTRAGYLHIGARNYLANVEDGVAG